MRSQRIERAAAAWLARRDSGRWDDADQAALDRWLEEDTAHVVAWLRIQSSWSRADRLKALGAGVRRGQVPEVGAWRFPRFAAEAPASRPRRRPRRALRAWAACLALAAAGAAVLYRNVEASGYRTAVGRLEAVSLADGSTVTLNSDSRLEVDLSGPERHLALRQGEVFFEVAKDPARPFVVQVDGKRVVAVGTRFSVRRLQQEIRVAVTEGEVRVEAGDGDPAMPPARLKAGAVARVGAGGVLVQQRPLAEVEQSLSWRNGYLVFDDTPLDQAVAEFNRYQTRRIVVRDPTVARLRVGGNFRWSNADAFVRLLEEALPVHARRKGDEIELTRK